MKKVEGYIYVRALGNYDFCFYVEDETSDEEIARMVEKECNYSIDYKVETGYKKRYVEEYYKD